MRSAYRTTRRLRRRLRRRLPPVTTSTVSTGGRRCGRLELANGPRPVPPRARPRAGGGLVYTMRSRRRPAHAFSAHRSPQPRSPGSAAITAVFLRVFAGPIAVIGLGLDGSRDAGTCGELNFIRESVSTFVTVYSVFVTVSGRRRRRRIGPATGYSQLVR